MSLRVEDWGFLEYAAAHARQQALVDTRALDRIPDTLVLVEHPPVITLGRGADPGNVRDAAGIPVVPVERGGDVTVHGPGQVVGWLVRRLPEGRRDLRAHLRLLEEILIRALADLGVEAGRRAGATGVWVGDRKIASLGVACRRWCTYHGFALNVGIDLALFRAVNPCGFSASVMTSLERETGRTVRADEVKPIIVRHARELVVPFVDPAATGS